MKVIILCAGYAKRMYPLTSFIAKPLLPVCGKPVVNFILDKLDKFSEIDEIFITTNKKFHFQFEEWLKYNKNDYSKKINLVKYGFFNRDTGVGGVDSVEKIINSNKIKEDLLVILGDNLFEYSLKNSLNFFKEKKAPVVILSKLATIERAKNFGVLELDGNGKIVGFEEKPKKPKTKIISTGIYFFPKEDMGIIKEYNKSKHKGDSFGYFLKYLIKRKDAYGFIPPGKFIDVGSLDDYRRANRICHDWKV